MFEQGAKVVVLSAKTMSITTTQRRFLTRWAPERNIIFVTVGVVKPSHSLLGPIFLNETVHSK